MTDQLSVLYQKRRSVLCRRCKLVVADALHPIRDIKLIYPDLTAERTVVHNNRISVPVAHPVACVIDQIKLISLLG